MIKNTSDELNFPISATAIELAYALRSAYAAAVRIHIDWQEQCPLPGSVASRLPRLCYRDQIAPSVLDQLIARGLGPRTFFIGRIRYVLHTDWDAWLAQLAETGGVGISGQRALEQHLVRAREQLNHQKETTASGSEVSTPHCTW